MLQLAIPFPEAKRGTTRLMCVQDYMASVYMNDNILSVGNMFTLLAEHVVPMFTLTSDAVLLTFANTLVPEKTDI